MGIILRFLLKNIRGKMFRTFMLVLSITFSTALFFSSLNTSETLGTMYINLVRKYFGSAEIIISAGKDSPSQFLNGRLAEKLGDKTKYIIEAVQGSGIYKSGNKAIRFQMLGMDLEDLEIMNPIVINSEHKLYPFTGNKIILSKKTAQKLGIEIGDVITININTIMQRFTVVATAESAGYFIEFGDEQTALIPKSFYSSLLGGNGSPNIVYIKPQDTYQKENLIDELSDIYKKYVVQETISSSEIMQYMDRIEMAFSLMVIAVLFMSVFIIYTAFNIIVLERLPAIGTLRSIGATKNMINIIMYAESVIYGVLGGGMGLVLGIEILNIMVKYTAPPEISSLEISAVYSADNLIKSFLVALISSSVSATLPILKASKTSIKSIVLNQTNTYKKISFKSFLFGCVLLAAGLMIPPIAPFQMGMFIHMACMVMIGLALVIFVPFITYLFTAVFMHIPFISNIVSIAMKNLRDNKNTNTNTCLLGISIGVLLLINTTGDLAINAAINVYEDMKFDIQVSVNKTDKSFEKSLKSIEGISNVYGVYDASNVKIKNLDKQISILRGVDTSRIHGFYSLNSGKDVVNLEELNNGRNIILTDFIAKTFNVSVGDTLVIDMARGSQVYTVVGLFDSIEGFGSLGLISEKNFKTDMKIEHYSRINVQISGDRAAVINAIEDKFSSQSPVIDEVETMSKNMVDSNRQLFAMLSFFSVLILIIGIIGMVNNLTVSLLERKHFLAIYRSIGMSKKQLFRMIYLESIVSGIVGGTSGVLAGTALITIMPYLLETMGYIVKVQYNFESYYLYIILGTVVMYISSIIPISKTLKFNIVEAIKFD